VTYLPFDLHPEYPAEGIPREQLNARYGEPFHDRLRQTFEANGLAYAPPPDVVPRTVDALRLTELARDWEVHEAFHDRLMDAYWQEGANIGDHDVLRALAAEVGLPDDGVERVLRGDDYAQRVAVSTQQAASIGASGIPAFVLNGKVLILGAQPHEVFERALTQIATS
jgi:predicted DsbA family dithiol-disulfide isomerase